MKFFMEKNKDAGHRVTIHIPKKIVNGAIVKELINIRKKTNTNGFRKGKTPIKVIQEKYGDTVYYDIFKQLMQKFFYEFIHQKNIKIIGFPKYHLHKNEDKKEYFEYSVVYEHYPEFQIKDIPIIQIKKITVNITNEDIKKNIEKYEIKKDIWETTNKTIKSHDRVTINYSVYEKNHNIKKFNTEKIRFTVSENTLIPDLNNKIINHFINDVIFFKIKFHALHPEKELQNKDITFKIKIIKIEKKQEYELVNTTNINTEKEKLPELHYENIKNNINNQINKISQNYIEEQIIEKTIQKNIILIPPLLLEEEVNNLYRKYKKQYKENNHSILDKKYHINLKMQAKKILYMRIIKEKIINDNKLFANEKNIQLLIKKISLNYRKPIEIINLYNKNKHLQNIIKNIELENQAINFLIKKMKIVQKKWTFDEFINYNWRNHEELII